MHWVSPMPSLPCDQTDSISPSWKKRKRDHEDLVTVAHRPSSVQSLRIDCPDHHQNSYSVPLATHPTSSPTKGGDLSCHPRFLPRKRRHLPPLSKPTYEPSQQQHFAGLHPSHSAAPTRPLSSNASAQVPFSPPVSPKTLVQVSYPSTSGSASALRSCHICHRRPTTRQLLDAYADCDLCGKRACYICLRQCDGLNCGGFVGLNQDENADLSNRPDELDGGGTALRRKICSSCAIEGVTETGVEIVRCLDCVHGYEAPWSVGSLAVDWTLDGMSG